MRHDDNPPLIKERNMKRQILLFAALLLPTVAYAHPGHADAGMVSGFMHPFNGLDHLVAMLAVGVWAARNAGMKRWLTPAAFLVGMIAGGVLGLGGFLPSFLESAVIASTFAAALLVLLAVRLPLGLPRLPSGTASLTGRNCLPRRRPWGLPWAFLRPQACCWRWAWRWAGCCSAANGTAGSAPG
jgi:hypothetical protein